MPFYVDKKGSGAMYKSDKRLLLTADGQVVGPDDPRGVSLLVAEGGEIPYPDAIKYGLVADPRAVDRSEKRSDSKSDALPLPTSAATAEKAADVLPKSLGTKTEVAKEKVDKK